MATLGQVHRAWRRFLKAALIGTGITLPQLEVLRALQRHTRLHPSEIAILLDCDRTTASAVIARLAAARWVRVAPNEQNRKYRDVRLTPEGLARLAHVTDLLDMPGRSHFDPLSCLDAAARAAFARILDELLGHRENAPFNGMPDDTQA